MKTSRRNFLKISGAATLAASVPFAHASAVFEPCDGKPAQFRLGIASYSLRNFGIGDVLKLTKRLGISAICFKSMHLAPDSGREQIEPVIKMFSEQGIDVYGGGVIYMSNREQVDQAFEWTGRQEIF